jgi:AraC-like DNA-binding protein
MPYLLRSGSLANYAEVARSVGLNPHQQLVNANISRYALLDSELRIPVDSVSKLLEASAASSGQIDFGLRMAESRQISDLGAMAHAMWEAPKLRMAVDAMARYLRLHNEALFLDIDESGEFVTIRAKLLGVEGAGIRQSIELVIGVIHRTLHCLIGRLRGSSIVPCQVSFMHAAPANTATYTRLFGAPVSFSQDIDGIVYRANDLEAALAVHDIPPARQAHRHLDIMLAQCDESMAINVRRLISRLLPLGKCSAEEVARHLGVDRRTVHRKLANSGENYHTILNDVRSDFAVRFAGNTQRPVCEVASLLGFASLSAFSRWFAGRFGCSVTAWREHHATMNASTSTR